MRFVHQNVTKLLLCWNYMQHCNRKVQISSRIRFASDDLRHKHIIII